MDKIRVERLECYGYHGVFPEENKLGQRYYIDMELELELKDAGLQDDLARSVNYAEVCLAVKDLVETTQYQLIEALAENIASLVLDTYTIVNATTIRVVKPHPPVAIHFGGVTVEIHRKRESSC
jgi:dihydroneopterin aldolase